MNEEELGRKRLAADPRYRAGYEAFRAGLPESSAPSRPVNRVVWLCGYRDAEAKSERRDVTLVDD